MRPRQVHLVLVAVLVAITPTSIAGQAIVGRWDLTMRSDKASYPSWFEVNKTAAGLTGRFQGRVGHATPLAAIANSGATFSFTWPDDEQPNAKPTQFSGTVVGSNVSGTMTTPAGKAVPYRGVRAPAMMRRAPPQWGAPIDLLKGGLDIWMVRDGAKMSWTLADAVLTNHAPGVDLITKSKFTDFKLHAEVNVPEHGNSGIYLRGRHEVQVLDSYGKQPGSREMGGVYGQVTPTKLPAKKPGEWQTFDITLIGRKVTIVLNGETIVDNVEIPGITGGALDSAEGAAGPIMLQGDHTSVSYRNVVITPGKTGKGKGESGRDGI